LGEFLAKEYMPSPSRARFQRLISLGDTVLGSLDISKLPPAARQKAGRAAALSLYDTLNRIQLPPLDQLPAAEQWASANGTNATRWVVPNTEIALERVTTGSRQGEFLFSSDTVARADEFYKRVRGLEYVRGVPLASLREIMTSGGGWPIPYRWIQAMPTWMRVPLAGQAAWKWIAMSLILGVSALFLRVAYRMSHRGSPDQPFRQAVAQLVLPLFVLLAAPTVAYMALAQVNLIGDVASLVALAATAVLYLAGAWICWRAAPVIAEAIIVSPKIPTEGIDAHLIRIATRLLGIAAAAALLAVGADRLGIPVYGIVAGLGVGGLAIALAAQSTVENLIGGLNLFADRPFLVGDYCRCGTQEGTIEAVGIRSTRLRGRDRTVTTIPNADMSKMSIVNLTRRDRMLLQAIIGVRYETSPEQLRFLLVKLRELLFGHPRIDPDTVRVRFIGFGASSLDIEIAGYVPTVDWPEFLGIREDVWLRVMEIVAHSGTGFAFPSQTLYFGRDGGLDASRGEAAEAEVRHWREQGRLPFPNFTPEQARKLRGTVPFPPPGAVKQEPPAGTCDDPD
jgi:MscS family membrane protein